MPTCSCSKKKGKGKKGKDKGEKDATKQAAAAAAAEDEEDPFKKNVIGTARCSASLERVHFIPADVSKVNKEDEDVVWYTDTSDAAVLSRQKDSIGGNELLNRLGHVTIERTIQGERKLAQERVGRI